MSDLSVIRHELERAEHAVHKALATVASHGDTDKRTEFLRIRLYAIQQQLGLIDEEIDRI